MKKTIHVGLYGGKGIFGGREVPLVAEVIECDKTEVCSLYKDGMCRNLRSSSSFCAHGEIKRHKGYTSRAKKYREFYAKWKNHEKYNALNQTLSDFDIIDDIVSIKTGYFSTKVCETNEGVDGISFVEIWHETEGHSKGLSIEKGKLTVNHIKKIFSLSPRALFDNNPIRAYKEKFLQEFALFLKYNLNELWLDFIGDKKESDFIDYIGKEAFIHTLGKGIVSVSVNHKGFWDGEKVTVESEKPIWLINKDVSDITLTFKPCEKYTVKVDDISTVTEKTKFL